MLVSVITVTLNPGKLLGSTVDSVVSQSCSDWEMIIQDGGSTDGSLADVESIDGIRIFRESDEGIYDAMNRALERANGDYLIFLNAGDCFTKSDVVTRIISAATNASLPDFVFCDYKNMANGRAVKLPGQLNEISLFRAVYCHQAIFFSKRLFDDLGGYDTSFLIRADLEFLYRCHSGNRSAVVRLPYSAVSYEGGGYSAGKKIQPLKEQELRRIRGRYMPAGKRVFYSVLHELTLVRFRSWWFRRKGN